MKRKYPENKTFPVDNYLLLHAVAKGKVSVPTRKNPAF
jgi:hypothetical protein